MQLCIFRDGAPLQIWRHIELPAINPNGHQWLLKEWSASGGLGGRHAPDSLVAFRRNTRMGNLMMPSATIVPGPKVLTWDERVTQKTVIVRKLRMKT